MQFHYISQFQFIFVDYLKNVFTNMLCVYDFNTPHFLCLYVFLIFFFNFAMFNALLNRSGESEHLCFILYLRGKYLVFHYDALWHFKNYLYQVEKISLYF